MSASIRTWLFVSGLIAGIVLAGPLGVVAQGHVTGTARVAHGVAPRVVLGCALGSVAATLGPVPEAVEWGAFLCCLHVLSLTDAACRVIPNRAVAVAASVRLGFVVVAPWATPVGSVPTVLGTASMLAHTIAQAALVTAFLLLVALVVGFASGRPGVGGGDVKLVGVAALYLGWRRTLLVLLVASVLGLASAAVLATRRRRVRSRREGSTYDGTFPWGPAIAVSCWAVMVFGRAA